MTLNISKRHKRNEQPLLFTGLSLSNRLHSQSAASQLVGDVFERLTASVAGAAFKRLMTDSNDDLCPDLLNSRTNTFIESKATQRRHYFKVSSAQLEKYVQVSRDYAIVGSNYQVLYYLWTYKAEQLLLNYRTTGRVIDAICTTVMSLDIIHASILKRCLEVEPENCRYREYDSWKNERGDKFKVLQVGHPFLERLREAPDNVLPYTLSLNPADYCIRSPGRIEKGHVIRYDGVDFGVNDFQVYSFTRPKGYLEFPELRVKDDIPF